MSSLMENSDPKMATDFGKTWTNEEILEYLLSTVIEKVYQTASLSVDHFREAASDMNPNRLRDRLIELQIGVLCDIFGVVDGRSAPTDWPGIKLVNGETGESLTEDLSWELSRVEGDYILTDEPLPLEDKGLQ